MGQPAKGTNSLHISLDVRRLPMAWDYAEASPFSNSGGNFEKNLSYVAKSIDGLTGTASGFAQQVDAAVNRMSADKLVSTDPPYYDNIGYGDLSDFLLRLAAPFVKINVSRSLLHARRTESRRIGRYSTSTWQQEKGRDVFSCWDDRRHAPPRRARAPRLSGVHLLRF